MYLLINHMLNTISLIETKLPEIIIDIIDSFIDYSNFENSNLTLKNILNR